MIRVAHRRFRKKGGDAVGNPDRARSRLPGEDLGRGNGLLRCGLV